MPARIVMMSGEKFVVDMGVDVAASEILGAADTRARLDVQAGDATKRVWVNRQHVAYVEDYVSPEPMVAFG